IFHPLVQMGEKMTQTDAQNLETIDYQGNDEISALVVSYNTMVRELRESTGKLATAERDKAWSEMARQVAHEIKNPLTPIKLEIQRLQRLKSRNTPDWEDKFDSVSSVILEHIDILSQTANEFSTFAKLYSEPSTQINLDKVLKEQIMLFSNRDVPITYLGEENTMIMGPKPQLIRVFVNLLSNALQAVEGMENPKLMVSLRRSSADGMWDIVVEDNGPGVSEENQSKLFTPNFTTKSSGTGLGLAICRSIVDRCGGRISYSRSFSLGGACFTVTLPAMAE
ncbi:MAG: ATP-binding protein, partial [Bacteroidales bacterium]|nr:ATP-binding protein [Bacteroidales bacterium]